MATKRQVEANRRNARNSTGPRSVSGKKQASQNAFRHGLTRRISGELFEHEVESLAHQIAGDAADDVTLDLARIAAEAELDLARVRLVKVALIERMSSFGSFSPPKHFRSSSDECRWLIAMDKWQNGTLAVRPPLPKASDPLASMPLQEPERSAEAMRRMLPDLVMLQRYESRAVTRRDRAIRAIIERKQPDLPDSVPRRATGIRSNQG
jgi:hypothetical protein